MNAMTGEDYRRSGRGGSDAPGPAVVEFPPDPFEDLAAPPMRLVPSPRRAELARLAVAHPVIPMPAPVAAFPAPAAVAAAHDYHDDHPFELTGEATAEAEVAPEDGEQPSLGAARAMPATEATPPAPPVLARSSGLRQLRAAVAVGLLTAAAIIALAVAFRPPGLELAADDTTPTKLGSGPVPAPAGTQARADAPAPSTAAAATTVRLRVDPDLAQPRRAALEAAIDAAGYGKLELSPTTAPIDRGRIEYFHPADEAAAEALARSLAPLTGGPIEVLDLSAVTLGSQPGRIDVWVAD